jgi:putative component of membrane protein insertase Oxa1/YidC/SpoIIIJ protein YidD
MLADTVCIMAVTLTTLDGVGPAHMYALALKSWFLGQCRFALSPLCGNCAGTIRVVAEHGVFYITMLQARVLACTPCTGAVHLDYRAA